MYGGTAVISVSFSKYELFFLKQRYSAASFMFLSAYLTLLVAPVTTKSATEQLHLGINWRICGYRGEHAVRNIYCLLSILLKQRSTDLT